MKHRAGEWVKRTLGEREEKKGNARQHGKVRIRVGEETDLEEGEKGEIVIQ